MIEVSQNAVGELAPGTLIAGRYRVTCLLGRGGMGAVYEAEHVELGRTVALKTLLPQAGQGEHVSARLIREARAAARIGHPGIVDVFDLLEQDGTTFVVMERLHGEELHQRIQREPRLDVAFALRLGVEVSSAIAAAHDHGIIHRDLKPRNVFIARDPRLGEVFKVLDFGIAKLTHDVDLHYTTNSGHVVGTPAYMAPERLAGVRQVDGRADIYAIGAMLYEALSGRPPFEAKSYPELVLRVSSEQPRSIMELRSDVPAALAAAIARALSKDPNARQASAGELAAELAAIEASTDMLDSGCRPTAPQALILQGHTPGSLTVTVEHRATAAAGGRRSWRWPVLGIALGISLLALTTAGWLGRWYQRDAKGTAERAASRTGAVAIAPAPAPGALLPAAGATHTTSAAPPATAAGTITTATTEVRFETDPPGAAVALDGVQACVTPCTRALTRDASVAVTLSLRGHASQRRALRPPLPERLSVQLVPKRARPSAGAGVELPGLPPLLPR